VETPNIDSLGIQGARLDNFFVNSAMCTPSRGCLMTGRYPDFTNTWANDRPLSLDETTLAQALRDAGYETGYVGKWHLSGEANPGWGNPAWEEPDLNTYGFADATYLWNNGHFKTIIEDPTGVNSPSISGQIGNATNYPTDFIGRKAVDFITRPRSTPFFLMVSFTDPHPAYRVRDPYAEQYDPAAMFLPPTLGGADPQTCRETRAQYCGMVKNIDDRVGEILAALYQAGQYENTIVIFTTDHGDYMGEHGFYDKDRMYEAVYRVPFLIQWPGRIAAGAVVPNLVSTVDVHPTLMSMMGLAANPAIQGKDAAHVLLNTPGSWEDVAFECQPSRYFAGLFTPEWHLFVAREGETLQGVPPYALYDRANDPWEIVNLFYHSYYQSMRDGLITRLVAHHLEIGSAESAWLAAQYGGMAGASRPGLSSRPAVAALAPARPNPFRQSTALTCELGGSTRATLRVYGQDGRCIRTLHEGLLSSGRHAFRWDGRDDRGFPVAAGAYRCELRTKDARATRLLVCVR
jgi:arylsulfatase A-like enzyme